MNLKQKDSKYIWHPFNQQKGNEIIPVVKGKGVFVFDEEGNQYIDGFSSWWVNLHGHAHPYIAKKIYEQALELEHIAFGGFTHPQAVKLSERLINLLPNNIEKIFFSDNGSTANEVALKMAIQFWHNKGEKRTRFIALANDYHGDTFGSMSLTARGGFNKPFETLLFNVDFIAAPTEQNKKIVLEELETHLKTNKIAAFIFEPIIQGAAGMLIHSPEILSEMIALCKKHNVITIADEVFTGFGRTGKWFASDYFQHKPDMICLSKGITGGFMPLGVTAVSDAIYQAFYSDDAMHTFLHGHSYTGNPLACAAANASLDLFKLEHTFEKIASISKQHQLFITNINAHKKVKNARCFGTVAVVELATDEESNYFNTKGKEAYQFLLKKGIILRPLGNVLAIIPPYCIDEIELNSIYQGILDYLSEV